jgi:hypothetical protein
MACPSLRDDRRVPRCGMRLAVLLSLRTGVETQNRSHERRL